MTYTTILLAAALQNWDRYSAHALAAREVAATLAKGASQVSKSAPCLVVLVSPKKEGD